MTLRCRKGDMAIVLISHFDEVKTGAIVDVVDRASSLVDSWRVSYKGKTVSEEGINKGRLICFADKSLLPIRPGDLDETTETERELTV